MRRGESHSLRAGSERGNRETAAGARSRPWLVPGAATAPPEGFVLRPWFGFAHTKALSVLSLPLLAIALLIAAVCFVAFAVYSPFRRRRGTGEQQRTLASNEFGFEHAIEAYEGVIDAHIRRQK